MSHALPGHARNRTEHGDARPVNRGSRVTLPASADVVIVGIGTAGAVVASRLARASISVVALEAGPDPGPSRSSFWPVDLIDSEQVGTSYDWGYNGPAADGRVLAFPRARVIGGCSSHNGCTQSIGWRGDWDAWGHDSRGWTGT